MTGGCLDHPTSGSTSRRASGVRRRPTSSPRCSARSRAAGRPRGSRRPPVRALENQLGLSKNTAQAAYDELVARGLVETREREGVFVLAARRAAAPPPTAAPPMAAFVPPPLTRQDFPARGVTALSTVFIDPELLPTDRL